MHYKIIRSDRKTLSVEITRELEVLVRAPRRASIATIERFVNENESWIVSHIKTAKERKERFPDPTEDECLEYKKAALPYLTQRVAYYAPLMDVTPAGIKITNAKTRFGSCSSKNRICFSFRVMQYPKEFIDYVVVHELAHIKHHDHSREFYGFIASVMPDYKRREKIVKGK